MNRWYSPLRYPGGKGKLYKKTCILIEKLIETDICYIEPYAGGAGLAIELLIKKNVSSIILNDYDISIYAFWYSILYHTDDFIQLILKTPVTIEEWYKQKKVQDNKEDFKNDLLKLGFSTFFLNRTNRSGIIKGGVLGGKEQLGNDKIDCRFNKEALIERIHMIKSREEDIVILNMRAEDFIVDYLKFADKKSFVFFDPPYYKKGPGLYTNFYKHEDHVQLEKLIRENVTVPYIITYDNNKEIESIYSNYSFFDFDINYSAQEHKTGSELIIFINELLGIEEKVVKSIYA